MQIVEIEDSSVSAGTVLAQSPQGGELLPRGSVVTITVSTSPLLPTPTAEPTPTPTQEPVPSDVPPPSPEPVPSEFVPAG